MVDTVNEHLGTSSKTDVKSCRFVIWDDVQFKDTCQEFAFVNCNLSINSKEIKETTETNNINVITNFENEPSVSTKHSCSTCKLVFKQLQEQAAHFKSSIHCTNLKRQMRGKEPLNSDDLTDSDFGDSDVSSSDEPEVDTKLEQIELHRREPKLIFRNAKGQRFSLYKCVIFTRKETLPDNEVIIERIKELPALIYWAVILLSAGHFAGAIFERNTVLQHKTFHRYVTRRKQGSSQSSHDQHHGHHAKSAGASLRRYNELALTDDIVNLMQSWQQLLSKCSHIFYRACGGSRGILFSGKKPILLKGDSRLRRIPFATKRPTYDEVVRSHSKLATIDILETSTGQYMLPPPLTASPNSNNKRYTNKSKKEKKSEPNLLPDENVQQEKPKHHHNKSEISRCQKSPSPDTVDGNSSSESGEFTLELVEKIQLTSELKTFEIKSPKKRTDNIPLDNLIAVPTKTLSFSQHDDLYTACKMNNTDITKKLLSSIQNKEHILNTSLGQNNSTTFLHIASKGGFKDLLWLLLEEGADPTVKDGKGLLPYNVAQNKETRNTFRRFVAKYPNKYNYSDSQIPAAISEEEEKIKTLKKQQQRQEKRLRSKENKIMQEEKSCFLGLTDKEKMTWGNQHGKMRCFQCGEVINKIPFEYNGIKCCSVNCTVEHRRKH